MQFKIAENVDAPVSLTWETFTDFSGFEEQVGGRGADLTRVGNWKTAHEGAQWRGTVTVRGKKRPVNSTITRMLPGELCRIESKIGGMETTYDMNFVQLGPEVTQVSLVLDLEGKTLTARLLLQTLKLARGRVMQRMQGILARQGNAAEAEHRRRKTRGS